MRKATLVLAFVNPARLLRREDLTIVRPRVASTRRSDRTVGRLFPHFGRHDAAPDPLLACSLVIVALIVLASGLAASRAAAGPPPYAVPLDPRAKVAPLVTCGDRLPRTGGAAGESYVLPGVPDGMGVMKKDGRIVLLVNHELWAAAGGAAGPVKSGARISELTFDPAFRPLSARLAFDRILEGDPPVPVAPGTRALAKLCSAFLATDRVGFDTPIHLTGEEDDKGFDGRGGVGLALVDRALHTLPAIGRAQWENLVVLPGLGGITAIVCMEDARATGDGLTSQLFLYVGRKDPAAKDAIARNGLRRGKFFTWIADGAKSEADFGSKKPATVTGRWKEVSPEPDAAALEQRARAAGAFGFVRIEDGAADPARPGHFYFATTGQPGTVNEKGRLYRLEFDLSNPAGPTSLAVVLDGSEGVVSPDNIDLNRHGELAICEDPVPDLRGIEGRETSDARLWIYDTHADSLWPVLEVNRDVVTEHFRRSGGGTVFGDAPGSWEVSGVVDAEDILGSGAWLLNVQAHSLKTADKTVLESGQILRLDRRP